MKRSIFVLMGILVMLAALFGVARQTEAGLTGGPAIIPAPPSVIDDPPGATNTAQQAFNERQGVVLPAPLEVDPGGAFIPAGTVVDSHMIFLNTIGNVFATDQNVVWTFDGPIVGVMSNGNGSLEVASSGLLGAVGTTYPPATFGARGLESNDSYVVGPANTITVSMLVTEPGDWIRVVTLATRIGEVKPPTPFTPSPSGNGRGIAFDGLTTLYYSFVGDPNIYKVTTAGVSMGAIPLAGRTFTCGVLEWDPGNSTLLCGTYDGIGTGGAGTADVWRITPATGLPGLLPVFNTGGIAGYPGAGCFDASGFLDGLSLDTDGTFWLSDDAASRIFHVSAAGGGPIASFSTPTRPGSALPGCNSGIEVVPGGFLELVLLALETDGDGVSHFIVKVPKSDPSGPLVVSFPTLDPQCCEDLDYDATTFAPRSVLWANGITNNITAYDVQTTRTIGYWKNHPTEDFDGTSLLPKTLGDGPCVTVNSTAEAQAIMADHKGQDVKPKLEAQLLAAKLNVMLGDIPLADLATIEPVIADADALLGKSGCNPDTGKKGADRAEAQTLHGQLDAFNNKYSP